MRLMRAPGAAPATKRYGATHPTSRSGGESPLPSTAVPNAPDPAAVLKRGVVHGEVAQKEHQAVERAAAGPVDVRGDLRLDCGHRHVANAEAVHVPNAHSHGCVGGNDPRHWTSHSVIMHGNSISDGRLRPQSQDTARPALRVISESPVARKLGPQQEACVSAPAVGRLHSQHGQPRAHLCRVAHIAPSRPGAPSQQRPDVPSGHPSGHLREAQPLSRRPLRGRELHREVTHDLLFRAPRRRSIQHIPQDLHASA